MTNNITLQNAGKKTKQKSVGTMPGPHRAGRASRRRISIPTKLAAPGKYKYYLGAPRPVGCFNCWSEVQGGVQGEIHKLIRDVCVCEVNSLLRTATRTQKPHLNDTVPVKVSTCIIV
jgi:hypothetical protein